jgi:dihydroorotase
VTEYLIKGASLLGGESGDLGISQGHFVPAAELYGTKGVVTIDAHGLIALPGLVDLHTHLRQPGAEQSETVLSGSQAAALGGFTAVHAMANTDPVADNQAVVNQVWTLGKQAGYVDVRPVGAVSRGLAGGELSAMAQMAHSSSRVRVFSDDGHCVADSLLMVRALEYVATLGGVIAQHAQDPRLTIDAQMNEGALSGRLGLTGWPAVAEESIIARDVLLAERAGARLHICHLSTAGSIEVIQWAKKRGIAVTAEVTPHHLLLTEDLLAHYDPLYKVNPPLRRSEDTMALREAVASGVIDVIATDHAPHPAEAKECAFAEAAFGMLGLETALPVVIETLVKPGHISWHDVARILSITPATIGSLEGYEQPLHSGKPAHLVLVDPEQPAVAPRASLSHNNPYRDKALPGRVLNTFYGGQATVLEGELVAYLVPSGEGDTL